MATPNEVDNDFELVGRFLQNEQVMALVVVEMNTQYPNVEFVASETGYGAYNLKARSRYLLGPIDPNVMDQFKEHMFLAYNILGTAMKHLEKEGLLK